MNRIIILIAIMVGVHSVHVLGSAKTKKVCPRALITAKLLTDLKDSCELLEGGHSMGLPKKDIAAYEQEVEATKNSLKRIGFTQAQLAQKEKDVRLNFLQKKINLTSDELVFLQERLENIKQGKPVERFLIGLATIEEVENEIKKIRAALQQCQARAEALITPAPPAPPAPNPFASLPATTSSAQSTDRGDTKSAGK